MKTPWKPMEKWAWIVIATMVVALFLIPPLYLLIGNLAVIVVLLITCGGFGIAEIVVTRAENAEDA